MAGQVTYKSLYTLVVDEINKRTSYNTRSPYYGSQQGTRAGISPLGMGDGRSDASAAELVTAIQDLLAEAMPPFIIDGLEVTAESPISARVLVHAGNGSKGGYLYTLSGDVTLAIPFDYNTHVFYINLYKDAMYIDTTEHKEKLTIAKVVVPQPGVTRFVQDVKDESLNAYIQSYKTYELHGYNDKFEEDTIELLRDNIGAILADNLIGNIRLSENLKITNTQGTLELDSSEIRLLSTNGTTLAKFNRNGTFFYNDTGIEIAKFSTDEARVGNILITKNTIQSNNFVSNSSGFRISDSGYAEFEDVRVRGVITTSVFQYNTISAVGGSVYVSNCSKLVNDMSTLDSSVMTVEDSLFSVDEILVIKDGWDEEYFRVLDISAAPTYTVERDIKGTYAPDHNPAWERGTAITSAGKAGLGYIKLDATSNFSPFMDIVLRNSNVWNDITTKVRLGNLAGITDPDLGTLSGFGLYSDNAYLKGTLWANIVKTANSGSRIYMDTDTFVAYDDLENAIFQIFMDNAPSGYDTGDLTIGDFAGNNGILWDASDGKMTLRGILSADDITTGSLSVSYLNSGTIAGASIILNPYSYMESSNFIYETSGWRLGGNGTIDAVLDRIQLEEVASAGPGAVANCGWIYTRDEGSITELFYKDSQGKEIQLTKDGVPDIMLGFRSGDLLLTSNTTVPSGWTDVSSTYDNRFIRISSGTALVTSGSDTHDHGVGTYSVTSHSHGLSGGGNTGVESHTLNVQIGDGDSTTFPGVNHTHPMGSGSTQGSTAGISGTSASGDNVPAYVQVKVYKRN